jgi:hypothetical protein
MVLLDAARGPCRASIGPARRFSERNEGAPGLAGRVCRSLDERLSPLPLFPRWVGNVHGYFQPTLPTMRPVGKLLISIDATCAL